MPPSVGPTPLAGCRGGGSRNVLAGTRRRPDEKLSERRELAVPATFRSRAPGETRHRGEEWKIGGCPSPWITRSSPNRPVENPRALEIVLDHRLDYPRLFSPVNGAIYSLAPTRKTGITTPMSRYGVLHDPQ
ncbi:hypothetical protein KM043_008497 [Ampulex compressa]|nr:hypothetical protein KM043_008497 [Ampulex compressa]